MSVRRLHRHKRKVFPRASSDPLIGGLPIAAVDMSLMMKVLQPIWNARHKTASRLRGRIEAVLNWATVSNFRMGLNPARWRGHLDNVLPVPGREAVS